MFQLVWFICPNVTLAEQQHQTIQDQLPAVQSRLLLGNDGTEHWTEQSIWNEVLQNIRIVVSTPQILFDVLTHVFVRMQRLALLVFDEAHHCTGNHPAARILQQFYHPERLAGKVVPHILGLTASPISNEKSGGLE
jgi:ERCC4-related helicase